MSFSLILETVALFVAVAEILSLRCARSISATRLDSTGRSRAVTHAAAMESHCIARKSNGRQRFDGFVVLCLPFMLRNNSI